MYQYTVSGSSEESSPSSDSFPSTPTLPPTFSPSSTPLSSSFSPCANITPSLSAAISFARTYAPAPLPPTPPHPSLRRPPRARSISPRRRSPRLKSPVSSPNATVISVPPSPIHPSPYRSPISSFRSPSATESSERSLNISDDVYESLEDYVTYTSPKREASVISKTLSLGKGLIGTVIAYLNAPSTEAKIASLGLGQAVRLDDVISIERADQSCDYKPASVATLSQLLEPFTHVFKEVTEQGFYKLRISDSGLLLRDFRIGVPDLAGSNNLLQSALQVGNFVVAKSHLSAITRSLDEISAMLNKIGGKPVDTKLGIFIQEAEELSELLALLGSVPSTDVQRTDFDTRVGTLRMEAKITLEETFISIEEHKVRFKQTLQQKRNIEKEDLSNAAHMFAQLCLWVKLSIFLANLLHLKDMINGNDARYIQLSSKHLLSSLDRSHRLHAAMQMFSPALLRKHGMFDWVKGFFYIEQPKLLHAMRRWRTDLEVPQNGKEIVGGAEIDVLVFYDPATQTLKLAEEM